MEHKVFLVYETDEWKTKSSFNLMFVATDKKQFAKGVATLSKELTGEERVEGNLEFLIEKGGVRYINDIDGIYVEEVPVNKVLEG